MEAYVNNIIDLQKAYFNTGRTRSIAFRIKALKKLKANIVKYEDEIINALYHDLRKPEFESYATEVGFVKESISYKIKHLKKWSKDKTVRTPIHQAFTKSKVIYEPYGTTLIIGPFNYPFQLLIEPMLGAIAAGNTVVLKPSEYTSHTEQMIEKLIAKTFSHKYVTVVKGGKEETSVLINSHFDYIFFTGSIGVGKIVMAAAAKNLTPVTLELGGKSPTIVHKDANLEIAAKRIAWGKFINAGQTCIAPDYVYVHESVKVEFLRLLKRQINLFYGQDKQQSRDYSRIVNERQFNRLMNLIDDQKVYCGGDYLVEDLYIEPTVMTDITWDDAVMADEIFGPILPVLSYKYIKETVKVIKNRPKPLALYLFTEDEKLQQMIMKHISFGGGCINDTLSHVASPHLPFGGVGHAGMGVYHGKSSFETFSHQKSIMKKATFFDMPLIYPPYENKVKYVKLIQR